MSRSLNTRLRRLERNAPEARSSDQVFVIEGATEAERQAHIDELIRLGEAKLNRSPPHDEST